MTGTIKILNFEPENVVTHPIVRVVGLVETTQNLPLPPLVTLTRKHRQPVSVPVMHDGSFKILLELLEGPNEFQITNVNGSTVSFRLEYRPLETDFIVVPLYVICDGHDGSFQAPPQESNDVESARRRILLGAKLLQCFTAEKLAEHSLGHKTFRLEDECRVFHSTLHFSEARKMSQEQLWRAIGRDILNSALASGNNNNNKKFLAFLSCTLYRGHRFSSTMTTHEDLLAITEAYVALGGGDLALFGNACLYTWPEGIEDVVARFEDATVVDKSELLDDSCYRGTRGACFSTTLGAVLHELYHVFDLGHTDHGVMGRGFDHISRFFTSTQLERVVPKNVHIRFEEEFESGKLSERLSNEHRAKDYSVVRRFEGDDSTVLTRSCAVILAFHRWFNRQKQRPKAGFTLAYDCSSNFIKSTLGIRAVELRKRPDEMTLRSWSFEGKVLKFSFRLPDEVVSQKDTLTLFVEDNAGNILKKTL